MLALSARCSEEGDSMMVGGEGAEAGGLKEPASVELPLGPLPSKALNACTVQGNPQSWRKARCRLLMLPYM